MGYVYLLHFSRPICPGHPCRHYLGYTSRTLSQRLAEHRSGRGARLVEVATERGIDFVVARTWKGNRHLERTLKNRKNAPKLCPLCDSRLDRKLLPKETRGWMQ